MYGLPSLQTFLLTLTYYLSIITCIHGLTDISIQAFANFQQNSIPPAGAPTPKALEQNQAEFIGEQLTLSIGGQQTQEQQIVRVIQHNEYENEQGDGEVVLLGEDPTTCNVMGDLEVEGSDLWMGPTPTYTKSAQQCCILCKGNEDCNAWTWCSNPQGCDSDKESYTQCKLKYDERVAVAPRWKNEGMGWISGFTLSNCPIMSVFERQRVDYSHFQNTCRDKNSMCTTCMCSLLEEFEQHDGKPQDLGLCMDSMFLGTLKLPDSMGGSDVSGDALKNLEQCPSSSNPCADFYNAIVFFSPRISFNVQGKQQISNEYGSTCQDNVQPQECAEQCASIRGCDAFEYNPVKKQGTCCFLQSTSKEVWFDITGWQTYFRMDHNFSPNQLTWQEPIEINEIEVIPDLSEIIIISGESESETGWDEEEVTVGYGCGACHDESHPESPFTCKQFKDWDLCDSNFLTAATIPNGYCALTCDRCSCYGLPSANPEKSMQQQSPQIQLVSVQQPIEDPCFCNDVPPDPYTCEQVNQLGLCNKYTYDTTQVDQGYCQITCGRCDCPSDKLCICGDVRPPGSWNCQQQKMWGKCETLWMTDSPGIAGYCQVTCGGCACVKQ
eukprot:TRINITY_DN17292_c0_g1_i4.p1 TRINITY_DN17292_c0_g1~~TRINITY_DN17292_c0_g1_i4.p1  ORF type:complete len:609 (-),score=81.66 TRINITY_DN17292_c0_g1_i4:680-2506(-)